MPRIKKVTVTPEVEPTIEIAKEIEIPAGHDILNASPLKGKSTSKRVSKVVIAPTVIPDPPIDVPKIRKPKFKEIHIKDNYWVENDIYQTIADMTKGNKGAKALIINQALKDYLKKNKIDIIPFIDKDKHKKN